MAEHSFPGGANPFAANNANATANATPNAAAAAAGMQNIVEEEEQDEFGSPTARGFASAPLNTTTANSGGGGGGERTFGNFAFTPSSGSRANPPVSASAAAAAMHGSDSFPSDYNMVRRTSVSAESLAPAAADNSWKAPHYPKTEDQLARLRTAVRTNFLFSHLDDDQSNQVLGALQERKVPAKDVRVIVQGDAGDYFYTVEQGTFDIYVSRTGKVEPGPNGMGTKVATNGPGSSFGELALMYNSPRAATVVSTEPSILWQLDRITFRRILMDSAFQRRRMHEAFLDQVPLLNPLEPYERSKIADALETTKYPAGSIIIEEGDVGDKFYLLESGKAEARKRGVDRPVTLYGKGDYFGELALLEDKPRAATVLSTTDAKVATLGKDGFQRLLGNVEDIMRRNDPRRKAK